MLPVKDQQTALEEFRSLPPIAPRELVGLWKEHGIPTGHPFDGVLENLSWFGKRFTPDMRVDALLFRSGDRRLVAVDPKWIPLRLALRFPEVGRMRVARNLFSYLQRRLRAKGPVASSKTMVFGGVESAAMVYGHQPIVDHFRRIHADRIMGAMTIRNDERIYFFELQRCRRTLKCAQPAIIYRSPPVSMIALPSSLSAAVVRVRQGAPRKGRAPCSFVSRVFLNLGGVILRTISVPNGSPRQKVQAVKPEQFLERWKSEHIDSGTQQSDAARLVEDLSLMRRRRASAATCWWKRLAAGSSTISSALSKRRSRRSSGSESFVAGSPPCLSEGRPFAHVRHRGIVLNLAKALVGCVAQAPVMGPATKLDLRDQGRLGEHQVLALERHGRFTCL